MKAIIDGFLYGFFLAMGNHAASMMVSNDNGDEEVHPELILMVEEGTALNDYYSNQDGSISCHGTFESTFREERLARILTAGGFVESYEIAREFVKTL